MTCLAFFIHTTIRYSHFTLESWSKQETNAMLILSPSRITLRLFRILPSLYEPRQANLCLRAFRHDKF